MPISNILLSEGRTVMLRKYRSCVKLKTTFNLSRELLAPPEPPSQRRVYFSSSLLFHLSTNCYQDMSMQHVTALY